MTQLEFAFVDFETYSPVPILHGTYAYAEQARVLLVAYAINDDDPKTVTITSPAHLKEVFGELREMADTWVFHNSQFDRTVSGAAFPDTVRVIDTMIQAYSHALPGSLEKLGEVYGLELDKRKSRAGKELIKLFCMGATPGTPLTHPKEWQAFCEYAKQDIVAMRELYKKMPKWNYPGSPKDVDLFSVDQRINKRGFSVDVPFIKQAVMALETARAETAEATANATGGALANATQRNVLLAYVNQHFGLSLKDLTKKTVDDLLADPDLPPDLADLMELRRAATRTSTAKYTTLLNGINRDGRLRGTLQFRGAGRTGRWSGRLFQPQNLPRPKRKAKETEADIALVKAGHSWLIGDLPDACADALRGVIIAPQPGSYLAVADLSNIEGRVQAWLAQEEWKLKAFRDYDAGRGTDLYVLAYARAFNVKPETVTPDQRQIGKVMELALAYGGGVGAFVTFANAYRINLDELSRVLDGTLPAVEVDEATRWLTSGKAPDYGLPARTFITCDVLKRLWRKAHPNITRRWAELEQGFRMAAQGLSYGAFDCNGRWVRLKLPSGRYLCYPNAGVDDSGLFYKGLDRFSYKWGRVGTYSGKLFENECQAVAADVLATGLTRAEYHPDLSPVLTVHDEIIAETPLPDGGALLARIMAEVPYWAAGLPLAAKGFTTTRYRKD